MREDERGSVVRVRKREAVRGYALINLVPESSQHGEKVSAAGGLTQGDSIQAGGGGGIKLTETGVISGEDLILPPLAPDI
jgi:hypothetical protein